MGLTAPVAVGLQILVTNVSPPDTVAHHHHVITMHLCMANSRPASTFQCHKAPCEACGKYGHLAVLCDMLAMAVFLLEYCKVKSHVEVIHQSENCWVKRNKKFLPHDDQSSWLILANYCAEMNFTEEQVDSELD